MLVIFLLPLPSRFFRSSLPLYIDIINSSFHFLHSSSSSPLDFLLRFSVFFIFIIDAASIFFDIIDGLPSYIIIIFSPRPPIILFYGLEERDRHMEASAFLNCELPARPPPLIIDLAYRYYFLSPPYFPPESETYIPGAAATTTPPPLRYFHFRRLFSMMHVIDVFILMMMSFYCESWCRAAYFQWAFHIFTTRHAINEYISFSLFIDIDYTILLFSFIFIFFSILPLHYRDIIFHATYMAYHDI